MITLRKVGWQPLFIAARAICQLAVIGRWQQACRNWGRGYPPLFQLIQVESDEWGLIPQLLRNDVFFLYLKEAQVPDVWILYLQAKCVSLYSLHKCNSTKVDLIREVWKEKHSGSSSLASKDVWIHTPPPFFYSKIPKTNDLSKVCGSPTHHHHKSVCIVSFWLLGMIGGEITCCWQIILEREKIMDGFE